MKETKEAKETTKEKFVELMDNELTVHQIEYLYHLAYKLFVQAPG